MGEKESSRLEGEGVDKEKGKKMNHGLRGNRGVGGIHSQPKQRKEKNSNDNKKERSTLERGGNARGFSRQSMKAGRRVEAGRSA